MKRLILALSILSPQRVDRLVVALLFVGGTLGALSARVGAAWREQGTAGGLSGFGVSLFEVLALGVAVRLVILGKGRLAPESLRGPGYAFAILLLWPSSLSSAMALALFGGYVAWRSSGAPRAAGALVAALATSFLWSVCGEPIVSDFCIGVDTTAVVWLLSMVVDGVSRAGNMIEMANGHSIVVLVACSTVRILPLAMLGWAALRLTNADGAVIGHWRSLAALMGVLIALNALRLAGMAWSADAYSVVHGDLGALSFDGIATLTTLVCGGALGRRHE